MTITVQSFLVCDSATVHEGSRLTDLSQIFDSITASNFPMTRQEFIIYIRLLVFDETHVSIAVRLVSPTLEERRLLNPYSARPDPNGKVTIRCRVPGLTLPEPGIYTLQLRVNGRVCSEYHITAIKRRTPPAKSANQALRPHDVDGSADAL